MFMLINFLTSPYYVTYITVRVFNPSRIALTFCGATYLELML